MHAAIGRNGVVTKSPFAAIRARFGAWCSGARPTAIRLPFATWLKSEHGYGSQVQASAEEQAAVPRLSAPTTGAGRRRKTAPPEPARLAAKRDGLVCPDSPGNSHMGCQRTSWCELIRTRSGEPSSREANQGNSRSVASLGPNLAHFARRSTSCGPCARHSARRAPPCVRLR